MRISDINNTYNKDDNRQLWEFTQRMKNVGVHCIVSDKKEKTLQLFYKLIKLFAADHYAIAYFVPSRQYGKQNLYISVENVAQSNPLNSIDDIEYEIKRYKSFYDNPIIFIKEFFQIANGFKNWNADNDKLHEKSADKIKELAIKYQLPIVINMNFPGEDKLKEFFFPFFQRRIDLAHGYKRKDYFDSLLCLYNSKLHSYNQRKKLTQKFELTYQFCNSKYVEIFITTCIGIHEKVIFTPPYIIINLGIPFIFDKRYIPHSFNGYYVNRSVCGVPQRYFPYKENVRFSGRFSPERIKKFVENNLELVSRKLGMPGLTIDEALDVITGDYGQYIQKLNNLRTLGL